MTTEHRVIEHVACRRCGGASSVTASFCGSCGAYLTYWGDLVRTEVVDEVDVAPGTLPTVPDTIEGMPAPIHPHHVRAPHVTAIIVSVAEHLHLAEHLHRHHEVELHRSEQSPESYAEFVADPEPIETTAFEPAPVLPELAEHHAHAALLAIERAEEHGRRCPTCSSGNATHRSFCRHCGTALQAPADVTLPKQHWWHRAAEARRHHRAHRLQLDDNPFADHKLHRGVPHPLARLSGVHLPAAKDAKKPDAKPGGATAQPPAAGSVAAKPGEAPVPSATTAKPPVTASKHLPVARSHPPDFNALRAGLGRQQIASRLFPRLGMAVLLGGAIGSLTIWRQDVGAVLRTGLVELKLLADVEERTITVQTVAATTSVPGRVPAHVTDGSLQTYWAAPSEQLSMTTMTLTFAKPEKVSALGFSSGIQNGDAGFRDQPRPHHVTVTFDDGTAQTISLDDSETFQRHDLTDRTTTTLTVAVVDTYPAVNGSGDWVALSEIVPLQRRL